MDAEPDLADVPDPLVPLIAACLAKDPVARPGLDDILARCAAFARPAPRPASRPVRARPVHARSAAPPPAAPPPAAQAPAAQAPARAGAPVRKPAAQPGLVPRRVVLLAGGVTAVVAAGAVFPLKFLAQGSSEQPAGSSSPAGARPRRGTQGLASRRSVPPLISRVLVLGPSGPVAAGPDSAVLNPDASTVAFSTSETGGARVWLLDANDIRVAASITLGHGSNAVVFSPDGGSLVDTGFGGQSQAARLWRLQAIGSTALNLTASAAVPRAPRAIGAAAFSPDGGHLAISGDTGLSVLDARTLRTIRSTPAPPGAPGCPVYRPDGKVLAVGGAPGYLSRRSLGGAVCLLDAASLNMITRRAVPDLDAYSLTFSPDGRTLALAGYGRGHAVGGVVRLLDATSLRTVATAALPGGAGVTAAAAAGFTPDGAVLAGYSVASDAVAWLMQASTLKVIASTRIGPASDVSGLAVDLSADGQTLMVAYTSRRARSGRIQLYQIQPG
jgi:hypothetical protein